MGAVRTEESEEAAAVATQKPGTKSQHPRGGILLDLVLELTHGSPLTSKCGDAKGWDTLRRCDTGEGQTQCIWDELIPLQHFAQQKVVLLPRQEEISSW